jgi:DNA ligase 1
MQFALLCQYFKDLEQTSSRNLMTEQLAEVFGEASLEEIHLIGYLALGRLAPLYQRIDFNLAEKMVMRALAGAYKEEKMAVLKRYQERGDLGLVAEALAEGDGVERYSHLSVVEVYERLIKIAEEGGAGSQERKVAGLAQLLQEVSPLGARYVIRIVVGKLRLGFSDKTILDAISVMETGSKQGRTVLEEAYQVFPDVGKIAGLAKQYGISGVKDKVGVTLGVPVIPALAQRLKTAEEMIKKMGKVMVEPKYDGTRVQIHVRKDPSAIGKDTASRSTQDNTGDLNSISPLSSKRGDWQVKTFTRNLDETSHMFPELSQSLDQIAAEEVILDAEAVGVDPVSGALLPFQATITRKRKHGIEQAVLDVPLAFFVFDILYKNGDSLLQMPLKERRRVLEQTMLPNDTMRLAPVLVTNEPDVLRRFHAEQLAKGLEGALIKQIDSHYVPGRRGWNWVKFKETEEAAAKLVDTIDGVVLGFYRGRGKRTNFGIGAFLVGLPADKSQANTGANKLEEGKVYTIAKVGTGLSDEQWRTLRTRLERCVAGEKPKAYVVEDALRPDIWVEPELVVEVAADEITKSPVHSAGWALRFPRLVKFRDDKNLSEATTINELHSIRSQSVNGGKG